MAAAPQETRQQPFEFFYLKDQKPLSQEGFAVACRLRDALRQVIAGREAYIRARGLNPEIHLPMANWVRASHYAEPLLNADYTIFNSMRLFIQVYTGYQLLSFSRPQRGTPLPEWKLPPDLDARLAERLSSNDPRMLLDVHRYLDTIPFLPEALHITPPGTLGEVGCLVDGKIVNHDTDAYLERLALLSESGCLWQLRRHGQEKAAGKRAHGPRILEIGGGFGGLAYHLKQLVPESRYIIVDLPESLLASSIYLSILFPDQDNVLITPDNLHDLGKQSRGFTFVPNFLFDELLAADVHCDLAINTLSMSEMSGKQVGYYAEGLVKVLDGRAVFFDQNKDNTPLGFVDAETIIRDYFPYRVNLHCPYRKLQKGKPHLWATSQLAPYDWQKSKPDAASNTRLGTEVVRTFKRWGKRLLAPQKA